MGADEATGYEATAGGVTHSESTLKVRSGQGEAFSIFDWLGNAKMSLKIFVVEIHTDVVPGYAKVSAELFGEGGPAIPRTPSVSSVLIVTMPFVSNDSILNYLLHHPLQ